MQALLFYCMLYTNFPGGITDVVARYVSFARIVLLQNDVLKSLFDHVDYSVSLAAAELNMDKPPLLYWTRSEANNL